MNKIFLILTAVLLASMPLRAQSDVSDARPSGRPRVGVVFGGGGAKGAAHIGVLKYLEEIGIPVDYVTGTSMGSIIGGFYALGYSPDELSSLIAHMDWSVYMSNSVSRKYLSATSRQEESTYLLSVPFNAGSLKRKAGHGFMSSLPSGVISGNSLTNLFNNLSIGYQDSMDFGRLPIPFACVACDIMSGESVVMRSGRFPLAIRASMAIPGVFSPVYMDGHVLVDGGLVNNFPVDVCREMGADIIIGVEVANSLATQADELQSLPQLINQYTSIAVNSDRDRHREMCDLYLHPDITGFGVLSFSSSAIDTLINRGYQQAQAHHEELMAIKQRLAAYSDCEKRLNAPKSRTLGEDTVVLASVTYKGVPKEERQWLEAKGGLYEGMPVTRDDIERAVGILTGTGSYTNITYNMTETEQEYWQDHDVVTEALGRESYDLTINLQATEPHDISLGLRYDSEESAALLLHIGLNHHRLAGFKALFDARLNYNPKFSMQLSHCSRGLFDANLSYEYHNSNFRLRDNFGGEYVSMATDHHNVSLYFSEFYARNLTFALGLEEDVFVLDQNLSLGDLFYNDYSDLMDSPGHLGLVARFLFEDMDHAYFATEGARVLVDAHLRMPNSGIYEAFARGGTMGAFFDLRFDWMQHVALGSRVCLIPQMYHRVVVGRHNALYDNMVGGAVTARYVNQQMPFIGFNALQRLGSFSHVFRMDLRCNVAASQYLTLMGNYLLSADDIQSYFADGEKYHEGYGVGLRYTYRLPVGPVSLDVHWSNVTHRVGLYFNFGYVF